MIVDVHAHLDMLEDKKIEKIIENARKNKVKIIINNGVNKKTNRKTLELAEKYPDIIKPSLGIYPEEVKNMTEKEIEDELIFLQEKKIVALGEIGLDYSKKCSEKEKELQQKTFEKQIQLAEKLNIPIIVHSRKAEKETIETVIKMRAKKVILHAFHGNMNLVKRAVENGIFVTVPTNVNRSTQFQKIVDIVPLSKLLTETDSPFLSMNPEKESEPADIVNTIRKIAEIKKMLPEETMKAIYKNYQRLFL